MGGGVTGGGAAAGIAVEGTGGPLEAGTRGNADPPVPNDKGLFLSGCAVGVTKGMRGIEPSRFGSTPVRGGEILGGGVSGILAAGAGCTGCVGGTGGGATGSFATAGMTGGLAVIGTDGALAGGRMGSTLAVSVTRPV